MKKGKLIDETETYKMFGIVDDPKRVIIEFYPDIGLGAFSNNLNNSEVFKQLKRYNLPITFLNSLDFCHCLALRSELLPFKVVVRRVAMGSYLKRHRGIESGTMFENLIVEFFLKTNKQTFKGINLRMDDPLIEFFNGSIFLYDRNRPVDSTFPVESFAIEDVFGFVNTKGIERQMIFLARKAFQILFDSWMKRNQVLADCKFEFGLIDSTLFIAGPIDKSCWRIIDSDGNLADGELIII